MPFGTITLGTESFEPSRPGIYPKTGTSLSTPTNELRFTAASKSTKAKRASISVTNIEHQDYIAPGAVIPVREEALGTFNLQLPTSGSFTETELFLMAQRCMSAMTPDRIRRLINGEN